jgi:hypothetical protein
MASSQVGHVRMIRETATSSSSPLDFSPSDLHIASCQEQRRSVITP